MQKSEEQKTVEDYLRDGNQLRKEGKLDQAIGQYEQALHLNPDSVPALSRLAGIYESQKQFGKALPYREKAAGLRPRNALLKAELARTMVRLRKTQEAITLYQKAIALNEHLPPWVYSGLGNALAKNGQLEEAIASHEKALELKPGSPDLSRKIVGLKEAIGGQENDPKSLKTVEDYLKAGNQLRQDRKLDQAIGQYEQALHLNPDFVPALSQLAAIYESQKQFGKALPYREQAAGLQPKNALLKAQLARTMMSLGKTQKAITLYQYFRMPKRYKQEGLKSLESLYRETPVDIKLLINISILAREVGDLDEAEAYLDKALDLEPDNASALSEMGNILKAKQDWKKAIIYYRKANQDNDFVNLLESLYHSDKSAFNSELIQAIENSKAIQFIKEKILSKLNIEYENHLILYLEYSNVGDICKLLALIKPLCIQHNTRAIVFYRQSPSPVIQAKLFLDPLMQTYVVCHFPIEIEEEEIIRRLGKKDKLRFDGIPVRKGIPGMMTNYPEVRRLTYITDESIYKAGKAASLGINIELNENTIGRPIINNQSFENALNKFKDLNLSQGKSILIAPHSVTSNKGTGSNSTATQFWQKIINALLDKNIIPVINARHHHSSLYYLSELFTDRQIRFADLSLDEVIPFVELCGAFGGVRSGLCDLIAFSSKKVVKLCVQPKNSKGNYLEKLPDTRVIDNTLINDNFHIYHLLLNQPIEDEQISQLVNLFSSEEQTTVTS